MGGVLGNRDGKMDGALGKDMEVEDLTGRRRCNHCIGRYGPEEELHHFFTAFYIYIYIPLVGSAHVLLSLDHITGIWR